MGRWTDNVTAGIPTFHLPNYSGSTSIECKRLQPARTVGEIAELLTHFRGEGKDRLGRHMNRDAWVRAHPDALMRHLGVDAVAPRMTPALVTNRLVPMAYLAGLPLSPDQIIPLDSLADRLNTL